MSMSLQRKYRNLYIMIILIFSFQQNFECTTNLSVQTKVQTRGLQLQYKVIFPTNPILDIIYLPLE